MFATIRFFGATGTVTGSRFLLEAKNHRMLVDCGLFQGLKENRLKNWDPFPVPPADFEYVLLTHAHIDHSGLLPRFCREGFAGSIYCTDATQRLCDFMLRDSAHLQEEDAKWANKRGFTKHRPALPLYTVKDAEDALTRFKPFHYGEDIYIDEGLRVKFKDAGHILGSSFVDVKIRQNGDVRRIVFSGDLGSPNRPILNDPVQVYEVDYLVLESTYGDRLHSPGHISRSDELARVINQSVNRGEALIIPSFAVERAQELLFHLRDLEERSVIPELPVYLDSPMAVQATSVFEDMKGYYDFDAKMLELDGKKIMRPRRVTFIKDVKESKQLHAFKGPGIIISASGMLEGGRILHHLQHRLSNPRTTVLFVGYQAEGTRGRALLNGKTEIKIHGQMVPVKAAIENISGFSGHADYREMLAWLMGFNRPPRKTFIVHGEPDASLSLAEKIKTTLGWETVIPQTGDSFSLT